MIVNEVCKYDIETTKNDVWERSIEAVSEDEDEVKLLNVPYLDKVVYLILYDKNPSFFGNRMFTFTLSVWSYSTSKFRYLYIFILYPFNHN